MSDIDKIYQMDKKFYKDGFFAKEDIKDVISGKTRNTTIWVAADGTAYLMTFIMPNKSVYIVALAGTKKSRRQLLAALLNKHKKIRIYTHGKPAWDMKLLESIGFKNIGRGNLKDETISFKVDLSKLWTYEIHNL